MINPEPAPWSAGAAELLNQFLASPTGELFLAQLAFRRPSLGVSSDVPEVALSAKSVAGYEQCFREILLLTEPPAEESQQTPDDYPPLDDETQWGQPKEK